MQEAVSSHNLILTRSKFVSHVYYMTLQCIGGNATSYYYKGILCYLLLLKSQSALFSTLKSPDKGYEFKLF